MTERTPTPSKLQSVEDAAVAFRQSITPKADYMHLNAFPLWHGWAIYDAFIAGATFARSETGGWTPVGEAMPKNGAKVLAFVKRDGDSWERRIRAFYCTAHTVTADESAIEHDGADYVEAEDEFYLKSGWYEENEYDEYFCHVSDPVTHWMPLPEGPK